MFARRPKFRLHSMQFPGAHLQIWRMTAPAIDLPGVVLCFNEHGKEQI
jgi:hypothetical protein